MFYLRCSLDCNFIISEETIIIKVGHFEYKIDRQEILELSDFFFNGLEIELTILNKLMNDKKYKSYLEFFITHKLLDLSWGSEEEELLRFKVFNLNQLREEIGFLNNKNLHNDLELKELDKYYFRLESSYVKIETPLFKLLLFVPRKHFQLKNSDISFHSNLTITKMLISYLNFRFEKLYSNQVTYFNCSFEDMLFDKSTCQGRSSNLVGGYFKQKIERKNQKALHLREKLNLEGVHHEVEASSNNSDFLTLQLNRSSCRKYTQAALPKEKLLELCERICFSRKGHNGEEHKLYPCGGAIHENEYFIIPMNVEGVDFGAYWLDQKTNSLQSLEVHSQKLDQFISKKPPYSWETHPHFYIYIATDLEKRSFKYEGIALKNSLVNTGVIIEFLTLNSIDIGLDSCPLGGGNGEAFLELLGLSPWSLCLSGIIGVGEK